MTEFPKFKYYAFVILKTLDRIKILTYTRLPSHSLYLIQFILETLQFISPEFMHVKNYFALLITNEDELVNVKKDMILELL